MGGGGSQPSTTTQINKTELPAWVDAASQENYGFAKQVADAPLQQYQGQTVADQSPLTLKANELTGKNVGSTDNWINKAGSVYGDTTGPLDINQYLNPYTAEVEKNAITNANRSLTTNLLSNRDQALKSKAFGGSRFGIQNAVTQSETSRGIGDLTAALRKSGVDYATTTGLADRQGRQAGAAGLLSAATGKKGAEVADLSNLYTAGQQETGYAQSLIDAAMKKFYEMRDYPKEQLNIRLAALGMSPYGKTETITKTGTSEKQGTDWATAGLGVAKMFLPMLMSDRTMKTDIEKLTGGPLPMYAYRYKGDPKSYPKVVGPMAQDVEKIAPKAVKKVGGKRVIDLSNLMEALR